MRQKRTSSPVRGTRECPGVPKRAQSVRPATVSATVYHWVIGEAQRFRRSQAPPPAFFSALPEELVLRVFSFLSVTELENMCVNRKFLRLFHEPALRERERERERSFIDNQVVTEGRKRVNLGSSLCHLSCIWVYLA